MDETIRWYVERITSDWGKKKLLGFLRALLEAEEKREKKTNKNYYV